MARAAIGRGTRRLNTPLDAKTMAFMLDYGEANMVIVDSEFAAAYY